MWSSAVVSRMAIFPSFSMMSSTDDTKTPAFRATASPGSTMTWTPYFFLNVLISLHNLSTS